MLAFNGVSKAIAKFTSPQYEVVQSILKSPNIPVAKIQEGIRIKSYLLKNGFLVSKEQDEVEILRQRNLSGIASQNSMNLILLPTLNCNFDCFYCYEDHLPVTMSEEVKNRIKIWGEENVPHYKSLNLSWFGGEPLLEADTVKEISHFFKKLCGKHNIYFNHMITTNGYLLSENCVTDLADLRMNIFNITVDGSPYWHNKFRILRNGKETFEQVNAGIIRVAKMLSDARINIRVNYNNDNFDSIPELFDLFPDEIRGRLFFLFRQIFGEKVEQCAVIDKTSREQSMYVLATQKGYGLNLEETLCGPRETFCYADKKGSFAINPHGEIFKCSVCKFSTNERMGVLNAEGKIVWNQEILGKWEAVSGFTDLQCQQCKYLPLCMGGCRAQRVANGAQGHCTQPFEHIAQLVEQIYLKKRGSQ